jgi:hypothetical protein
MKSVGTVSVRVQAGPSWPKLAQAGPRKSKRHKIGNFKTLKKHQEMGGEGGSEGTAS